MTASVDRRRRRVRAWFGKHAIADYMGEPALAARYEQAMKRRFARLLVTNDPLGSRQERRHD